MASFDIIEASGKAYIKAWEERQYLLKLALIPLITKILFFCVVMALGADQNILRQTIIMLPAYFFEGWMVAVTARLIFFGERWPMQVGGDLQARMPFLERRGQAIFAAILFYVLIKMMVNGIAAPFVDNRELLQNVNEDNPPPFYLFALSTFFVIGLIWAFKYLFVFIPVVGHIRIKEYAAKFPGITSSFYFIGAWLTCYIPFVLFGAFSFSIIGTMLSAGSTLETMVFLLINFFVDLGAMIVMTICFALVIKEALLEKKKQDLP